eukprot:g1669.t1
MVRFHWYSEDGCDCQVHPGSVTQDSEAGVLHATAELKVKINFHEETESLFQVPGQRAPVEVTFSMPNTFLKKSKGVGIFLTLGDKAIPGNLKFVADFGTSFAKQGHIVVRQFSKNDDTKRQQEVQKTINACVASPYAKSVRKWVLVGVGTGCQIATSISHQFEESLRALVYVASPLTLKAVTDPEVSLKVPHRAKSVPILFLHPSLAEACNKEVILERLETDSSELIKYMNIPDVDQNFRTSKGKNAVHVVSAFAVSAVFEFLNVLENGDLKNCLIPSLEQLSDIQINEIGEDSMNIDQSLSL